MLVNVALFAVRLMLLYKIKQKTGAFITTVNAIKAIEVQHVTR